MVVFSICIHLQTNTVLIFQYIFFSQFFKQIVVHFIFDVRYKFIQLKTVQQADIMIHMKHLRHQ